MVANPVYAVVLAAAKLVKPPKKIDSGKKALQHLESLPLLIAKDAADSAIQKHKKYPKFVRKRIAGHIAKQLQGVILVAASAFTFSLLSPLVKFASYSMSSLETIFWRCFIAWIACLVALYASGVKRDIKKKPLKKILFVRSVLACCAMSLTYYAMQQTLLADVSLLIFMSPIFTFFLALVVLKEKIDGVSLSFAVFAFVGIVWVVRPTLLFGNADSTSNDNSPTITVCALLGAMAQSGVYVTTRQLKKVPHLVIIHHFLLMATVCSALAVIFIQKKFMIEMSVEVWLAVAGTGMLWFLGQSFLTRGFQLEAAGIASVICYLDVALVFLWDVTLLEEPLDEWSVVGCVLICLCVLAVGRRRAKKSVILRNRI